MLDHPAAHPAQKFALFNLGFRPFFLLALVYALVSILVWGGIYVYGWPVPRLPFPPAYWHAHEMIFGYGLAAAAGFLLTATRNWTRIPTLSGYPLAGLAALWLAARAVEWIFPEIWPMMALDLLFDAWLVVAVFTPILRAKQHDQIGIASKLVLLMLANLVFYLGVAGMLQQGIAWGLYSGLYFLLALMFSMARRVVPFFIEHGAGYPVQLKNRLWLDRAIIFLFFLFWLADVFWRHPDATALLAALLFAAHLLRLADWHTRGIWSKPLLWVLYLGYGAAVSGFLIKAVTPFVFLLPFLDLHAFAVGGIAMMTAGMMARISLGHTGRNISQHSRLLAPAFALLAAAFVVRVLLPMFAPLQYKLWIAIAQLAWLFAFALLAWVYVPVLVKPRIDGMPG